MAGRTLIICEKNDAAKQIAKVLSDGTAKRRTGTGVPLYEFKWQQADTVVMGLRGHILQLDFVEGHKRWSIQSEKLHALVDADIQKDVSEEKIVRNLRQQAKAAERIIVATDYDREGELIGVEALEALGKTLDGKRIKRAKYSSFTKKEVKQAFDDLQEVDYKLAQAGEARQTIDLAWGAALTRYVSVAGGRRGRNFLSVGRVQTPTLALIVERDQERAAFRPDPYWEVTATLEREAEGTRYPFEAAHVRNGYKRTPEGEFGGYEGCFASHDEAAAALQNIQQAGTGAVQDVDTRERTVRAPIPFSTTGYQQAASSLGLGVKRAMDIAQKLYLAGLISYHRTENTVYPSTLEIDELLGMLAAKGGTQADAKWVQQHRRPQPTRGKKETTDHPPIYPTGVPDASNKLSDVELRVWDLVARRFLATLSPDARVQQVTVMLDSGGERLKATGQTTLEPGWRKVYPYSKSQETPLPPLEAGMTARVTEADLADKETEPPKRYGQGSLIAKMEELGIGTKATRHETIQKLIDRGYITESPVEATQVGHAVMDSLLEHARTITTPEMTAKLEAEMDGIAEGKRTFEETIADSRTLLHTVIDTLLSHHEPISGQIRQALEESAHVGTCPKCGDKLLERANRFGGRFIGCKGYPDCDQTYPLPPRGQLTYFEEPCEECGSPRVEHNERGRKTELCVDPECPTRKEAAKEEHQELGTCPKCGSGTLEVLKSRNWKRYVACSEEGCDQTYPLPQRGAVVYEGDHCEHCGSPEVKIITKGRKPWEICINMECPGRDKKDGKGEKRSKGSKAAKGSKSGKPGTTPSKSSAQKGAGGEEKGSPTTEEGRGATEEEAATGKTS